MNLQIEQSMSRLADNARGSVRGIIKKARLSGRKAAAKVVDGKKPVRTLSGMGLKLSAVSHRTTDRVVKQQTLLAVNQIDALADRLESATGATCLRDLVKKQFRMTPDQFKRFGTDARESFAIIMGAGNEAGEVVKDAVQELRAEPAKPRKKATRKKAARKKVTRKTPAKKVRKAAATKTTAAKKVAKKRAKKVRRTAKA